MPVVFEDGYKVYEKHSSRGGGALRLTADLVGAI